MPHFRERGSGSENGPRLSLGNGATFALKVPCFAVSFFAGWRVSRAAAPDLGESSIGVVGFGLPGGGGAKCTVKYETFATFGVKSSIVLVFLVKKCQTAREP